MTILPNGGFQKKLVKTKDIHCGEKTTMEISITGFWGFFHCPVF
jgi:hypothetical protein